MTRALVASFAFALLACRQSSPLESGTSAGGCPPVWLEAPVVDPAIAVPSGSGRVVFHASAKGTQNYVCKAAAVDSGASYAWSFVGPEAALNDCHASAVGRHFASDAGAPEWQLVDGAYVVAHKAASAPTADDHSVPALLLSVDGHGGSAPFTEARYVQRVRTNGGVAPRGGCDATLAGTSQKVPYVAEYFFYAP